jgi:hypothetical protein
MGYEHHSVGHVSLKILFRVHRTLHFHLNKVIPVKDPWQSICTGVRIGRI